MMFSFGVGYLTKTIEAPELQQEVKKFTISNEGDYASILDKVFKDYRAMETNEHMRSGDAKSVSFAAHRGTAKAKPSAAADKGDSSDPTYTIPS